MQPIRTIVVDDEPEAREGLTTLLRRDAEIAIVAECGTGREAVAAVERERPDLAFLDIQMPELDGLEVARAVGPERLPIVVFVTAYHDYALRAFEAHALDYLLKPFSDARFADALGRAKALVRQRRAGEIGQRLAALFGAPADPPAAPDAEPSPLAPAPPGAPQYLERIMVRTARRVSFVRVDEIDWIEADSYYAKLHVAGRTHLIRETMQQLETRLDPRRFVRVHRSAIVNVDRVQTLHPYLDGKHVVTLRGGARVTLSRSRREAFERALGWRV